MQPMSLLIVTCILFVGSHLLLSHPLRAPLAGRMGERPFQIVYSVVAIATLVMVVQAWRGMPQGALIAYPLAESGAEAPNAAVLFAPSERQSIEGVAITNDAVLVAGFENVRGRILRIAQEGVTNVLKHARAGRVELKLVFGGDSVRLTIADDGVGFNANAHHEGFGLLGMRERAERIGARLLVGSRSGQGTRVESIWAWTEAHHG